MVGSIYALIALGFQIIYNTTGIINFILIIITLGVSIILKALASLIWGTDPFFLPDFSGGAVLGMAGFHVEGQYLVIMGSTFLIMILLGLFFGYTRTGFAMRACFYNRPGARLVGIDVRNISTVSFGMGAILGEFAAF